MTVGGFLKDKIVSLFCYLSGMGFIALFLKVQGLTAAAVIFAELLLALTLLGFLLTEYGRKKPFYEELSGYLDSLDKKHLLSELLEAPSFEEGRLLCECLARCNKSMNDEIAGYRSASKEYREYIELWIHEVKTPIASARLILDNHPEVKITASLAEELLSVETYVEQALYYARSSSVEKDYIIKAVNLQELLNAVLRKNAKVLIRNRFQIYREDLDHVVYTDQKWMEFILQQIVINAVKYRKDAGGELRLSAREEGQRVLLLIEDNGIGISAQDLPRIFEKGYTGSSGRKYSQSTGIGLYLCKKLCNKLGILIAAESAEGEWTRIKMGFPKDNRISEMISER